MCVIMGHLSKINILILFYIAYSLKFTICIVRLPYLLPQFMSVLQLFAYFRLQSCSTSVH